MAFSANEFHHVLLVDHDSNSHASVLDMLHYFSYKVTTVKLASTALSMLSKGKSTFDIVIANINSPDFYGFKLLQEAVKMDLFVMLMLDNEDVATATKGLEEGAFLCVTKPITMETVKYLWQHVLREKISKLKANKGYEQVMVYNNGFGEEGHPSGVYTTFNGFGEEGHPSGVYTTFENDGGKYNSNGNAAGSDERHGNQDEDSDIEDDPNLGFMKRKIWTEWTEELHEKFVDAVIQLGEGRCYPKEILDLMNVPGLTRMQVASHLQKCRGGTWLPPNERKYKTGSSGTSSPTEARAPRTKTRRFGSMPILVINPQDHQNPENSTLDELNVNSSVGDNSTTSSDAEGYRPQFQPQDIANGYYNAYGHVENYNAGAPNMWHLGLSLGMDDPYMSSGERFSYGDQAALGDRVGFNGSISHQRNIAHEDTFEFRNGDFMVQNTSALQQELGIINYNGSLHALDLEQMYSMQIPIDPNANNGQWILEESGSDDNKETQR